MFHCPLIRTYFLPAQLASWLILTICSLCTFVGPQLVIASMHVYSHLTIPFFWEDVANYMRISCENPFKKKKLWELLFSLSNDSGMQYWSCDSFCWKHIDKPAVDCFLTAENQNAVLVISYHSESSQKETGERKL